MNGFDGDRLIRDLARATTVTERFAALTSGLAALGLDTINYGILDPAAADLESAHIQFLTTMSDDWMTYYVGENLAVSDIHVARALARNLIPYRWGETQIDRIAGEEKTTALQAVEAGLRSTLCVPLSGPLDPFSPVGAINLGSSMGEREFDLVMKEHGAALISIAHIFHNASIRQFWREWSGRKPLSARERDCLRCLAEGKRQDAVAHALGISRVTVELHLRGARQKLDAVTVNEAIARALLLGEIDAG
ncbi:MAG: LuxR C-terminal-related transcriptional regulator [bacterium]|nr:LuxR C-terminal-related transcriptional regulator [bacterium]